MNHGDHGGHGGHDSPMSHMCAMSMLWNTQIIDTCIVFSSWHIQSHTGFFFSCLAIVALGVFYEYLRVFQKKYDIHLARAIIATGKGKGRATPSPSGRSSPEVDYEENAPLNGRRIYNTPPTGTPVPVSARLIRAALYGVTVFISFFLMLVFMTYNAYLIFAVVAGAALGHYIFGSTMDLNSILSEQTGGKTMACH